MNAHSLQKSFSFSEGIQYPGIIFKGDLERFAPFFCKTSP